jgi:hypothetical protein
MTNASNGMSTMSDIIDPNAAHPEPASLTRRRLVGLAGGLGLAATAAATLGAGGVAAGEAAPTVAPGALVGFGEPPAKEDQVAQRVQGAAAKRGQAHSYVKAGAASGPEPVSAAGLRLKAGNTGIDNTPLARRKSGVAWTVRG